ncbi:MAG TPA: serine hydrolase domain-containing protein [Mycobacteriales bacterium]|nr:serine hydrolase domain-containing protein [Mycobacteriales bacterium]
MDTREWLDGRVAAHEFSGAALVRRGGETVFAYAGGVADRRHGVPVTEATRFTVASVTKIVTAATALRLVGRGALTLDGPVLDVLPAAQHTAALSPGVTLHHLLTHTSGLPNYHDGEDETWESWLSCWDRVPPQRARGPADLLPLFRDLPAQAPPGARFAYADANFILAGLLVEAVTGRPFGAVATEEVLVPAGMAESGFDQRDDDPAGMATGYRHEPGVPFERWKSNVFAVPSGGMPDGGLVTTTADLARLLDALPALLGPETYAAMSTARDGRTEGTHRYGYGLELGYTGDERVVLGHGGLDPGISAAVARYPAADTTIVVLCNHDRGSWPVYARLAADAGRTDPRD